MFNLIKSNMGKFFYSIRPPKVINQKKLQKMVNDLNKRCDDLALLLETKRKNRTVNLNN
jgi:hypothetical protein